MAADEKRQDQLCQRIEAFLWTKLQPLKKAYAHTPQIIDAVIYSAIKTGGKRIRPLVCYGAALAFSERIENTKYVAAAVELIHCYSLIHDDLPSMDDDDFRRNMPSCHKLFGEANAILAGDMMQVLAFQQIIDAPAYKEKEKQRMTHYLATAARDMVCGQSLDLVGEERILSTAEIETMHSLKTAALIRAAIQLGALSTGKAGNEDLARLSEAGDKIGLAFQIQDDLLDMEEETKEGIEKSTYPKIAGTAAANQRKKLLLEESLDDLAFLPVRADFLRDLFVMMVTRKI